MNCTAHERLRKALENEATYGPYRLVLELGRDFPARRPPHDMPEGEFMNCFYSSFEFASRRGLVYCEGWATSVDFPTWLGRPHAWCLDENDQVVDVAYSGRAIYGVVAYRGVAIPLDVAQAHTFRGSRGVLLAYEDDPELLRTAIKQANEWS